jgi:hypothetical protein
MFNTLGNLILNPRAGVVVPDFERGRMWQATGVAEVLWNQEDPAGVTGGTHRFWAFRIEHWLELALPLGVSTEFMDLSPFNPPVAKQMGRRQRRNGTDGFADQGRSRWNHPPRGNGCRSMYCSAVQHQERIFTCADQGV